MIPKAHILEWATKTPWPEERQVEQDLIICRALVAIFSDDFLRPRLAFRGGTALNKLFFSGAYRYSEDIDLVQTTPEPIGPTIDALRNVLDTWLGRGAYQPKMHSPKMIYKVIANDGGTIRLKVEINTREHAPYFQSILAQAGPIRRDELYRKNLQLRCLDRELLSPTPSWFER